MNKELNLKHIILIVIPFAILLFGYLWSTGKAAQTPFPSMLKSLSSDQLIMPLSDGQIYVFNTQGKLINYVDSRDLGITNYHGDIQFINSNELIIYGGYDGKSTLENLATYARITPKESFSQNQGLWHCYLDTNMCRPLSNQISDLKRTFHLTYDNYSQHLYVANTALHEVYQLDLNGKIISRTKTDTLQFPNQLRIFANHLWLSNTNHHKVVSYPLGKNSLQQASGEFEIKTEQNCHQLERKNPLSIFQETPHCFPNALALVDKTLWVGVAKPDMENNEIQQFSTTGEFLGKLDMSHVQRTLSLDEEPDPISFVQVGNYVVFSDVNNRSIYRYNLTHQTWSTLDVEQLSDALAMSLKMKRYYANIGLGIIVIFCILIALGVIIGIKPHLEYYKQKHKKVDIPVSDLPIPNENPFWFSVNKKVTYLIWGFAFLIVTTVMLFIALMNSSNMSTQKLLDDPSFIKVSIILLYCFFICAPLLMRRPFQSRLGIAGRLILVNHKSEKTAISPLDQVYRVGERGLLVEDFLFLLGSQQLNFIDEKESEQFLKPRLPHMKQMSEWGYFKYRLANPDKDSIIFIALLTPVVITSLFWL